MTPAQAEAIVAGDLLTATRRVRRAFSLDDLVDYLREHPDATPDEVTAALSPLLDRMAAEYVRACWGTLAEDMPVLIDRVTS